MDSGDYLLQAIEEMVPSLLASPIEDVQRIGYLFKNLLHRVQEKAWQDHFGELEKSAQLEEAMRDAAAKGEELPPF